MTHEKHKKIVRWSLAANQGKTIDQQTEAIVSAVELALGMEGMDDEPQPVEDTRARPGLDMTDVLDPNAKYIRPLPPSPAVAKPPEGRLIIMPDSPEFSGVIQQELKSNKPPQSNDVVIPPPREGSGPRGEPTFWKPAALSKVLHENTPERLKIQIEHPERGQVNITLDRNVEVGYGFDTVKLSYKHTNAPEEFQVAETFSITQKDLPITQALERIRATAVQVYSPKQRGLPARQPAYQGPAQVPTIDPNTPHDSV